MTPLGLAELAENKEWKTKKTKPNSGSEFIILDCGK
jgi:hypothetical protein